MTIPAARFVAENERSGLGFTSVIRHLSLRGWLRWIYSNGSDAALRVRTRDGGSGNIWCSAGNVVDADWGQQTAEEALQEMLQLPSGAVTIDFDPVERAPRITKPMHELLRVAGTERDRVSEQTPLHAALATAMGTATAQPFRSSLLSPPTAPAPTPQASSRLGALRTFGAEYVAGGALFATLVVAAFALGRLRGGSEGEPPGAPEPDRAQQTRALLPPPSAPGSPPAMPGDTSAGRELPLIPFVRLELEPADAEIWLDQALVAVGRIELAPMPDGALHELRFVAASHETRSLFFVGTPPAGRVLLERAADRAPEESGVVPMQDDAAKGRAPNGVPHRAPAAAPTARSRARAPAAAAPRASATQIHSSSQGTLIEPVAPRIQVLD